LDILLQLKGKTTVVFSTHILSDVERICDSIAVIKDGQIVFESGMNELKIEQKSKSITLEYEEEVNPAEILRVLEQNNLKPAHFETAEVSIENLFMQLSGEVASK
jgi:ABC-2 type transport system ATP-binding protein